MVAALIAAGTAGFELARLGGSADATLISDAWRACGLVVFAGLFALVAWRPTSYPGVLELSILHKAAVTMIAVNNTQAADAWGVAVVDGLIALALIAGYLLLGCYRAWKPTREPAGESRRGSSSAPHTGPSRGTAPGEGAGDGHGGGHGDGAKRAQTPKR
ncbi:MAG: hypothetical protein Q4F53_04725 [Nesterenkonia sp.]|nr:hypothetical protein [Nesterenkonia sp.]